MKCKVEIKVVLTAYMEVEADVPGAPTESRIAAMDTDVRDAMSNAALEALKITDEFECDIEVENFVIREVDGQPGIPE